MNRPIYIPIQPGEKVPLVKGWSAEDPPVEEWWADVPDDVNKAIRLDGFVMVDCDTPELASWFMDEVCAGLPMSQLPAHVRTPRGSHYYWRLPEGETMESFVLDAPYEGDIRVKSGAGQYALVDGSTTSHGIYQGSPHSAPVAPPAVLGGLRERRGHLAAQAAVQGVSGRIPEGMRNTALTGFAGLMRRYGFDSGAIERVLVGLNRDLTDEPLPDEEIAAIVRSSDRWDQVEFQILDKDPGTQSDDIITWGRDLQLKPPPPWMWRPYLPVGRLVLLDGDEGIGKGMFCAWAAKQVISGEWGPKGNVLWAASEDDPEEDIKRRLMAVGIDGTESHDVGFFNEWPAFPRHAPAVKALIEQHGAKLLILDPGRSFIHAPEGVTMSFNDEAAVRPAMEAINRLAKETGCTIIFVHHWNKDSQGSVRSRAGGTKAFTQVVRHRVSVAKVGQGDQAEWAMEVTKSNIAKDGGLRAYRLVEDPQLETARFVPGDPLEQHNSLGSWVKDREHALNNTEIEINYVEVVEMLQLPPGTHLSRGLLEKAGVPRDRVPVVLDQLEERGLVAQDGQSHRRVWQG